MVTRSCTRVSWPLNDTFKLTADLMNLQSLIEQQKSDFADFIEIDQTLRELRNGAEPNQLPPANPAVGGSF